MAKVGGLGALHGTVSRGWGAVERGGPAEGEEGGEEGLAAATSALAASGQFKCREGATGAPHPKTAAVALPVAQEGYVTLAAAEQLASENIFLDDLGIATVRANRAVTGDLLLQIPGPEGGEKADRLAQKLREQLGQRAVWVARSIMRTDMRVYARDIVVDYVRNILLKHDSVKINTILNGEFVVGNKCANKSVNTKNCELFRLSDLREWYDLRVIEPILASLDEFQERDSGWALSRILNLIVNVNKYMPMHAGCAIQLPREVRLKKAVINVCSTDNACFAWSVVAALYPAESHVSLASSYPHYTTVLNIQDIEFPMTLNQIKKFEHINNISINVYTIENKKVLPIRVTDKKMERHVNLLYLEGANDIGTFHMD
ncbi:uncharacterized protein LOC143350221 [Colletes latitarsis]|uniref:uncharacterized protein LOC143350221 n=1 Tax=Colletes latitarsis TaxID=2605962 RepID=UPI004036971B